MAMREILFRGKCGYDNEWVEGFYYQAKLYRSDKELCHYITIPHPESNGQPSDHIMVHPETVGQFTDLTDKNGQRVFEGDILKLTDEAYDYEWIAKVEFGNPNAEYNWGFQLVHINGPKPNTDILCWFDMEEVGAFAEVIGNIYDNPELLEVE
jgi:uncharacterized phage protein (TIGR01671 family)